MFLKNSQFWTQCIAFRIQAGVQKPSGPKINTKLNVAVSNLFLTDLISRHISACHSRHKYFPYEDRITCRKMSSNIIALGFRSSGM
jgi:hypothetical protein